MSTIEELNVKRAIAGSGMGAFFYSRGRAPFDVLRESRPLRRSNFLSMRSQSDSLDISEHVLNDEKSLNRGLPVLDLARGSTQRS